MDNYKKTILISVNELKTNSIISNNVDDNFLSSSILTVQDIYLSEILGTALLHKLQNLVYNKIVKIAPDIDSEGNEIYKELFEEYVIPYLKYKTIVEILYPITYKIRNAGVVKNSDTNLQTVPIDDIKYLEKDYSVYVDEYSKRMSKFLCAHREVIEEVEAEIPSYYDAPSVGNEYATCDLWLGGRKKNKCGC